MVACGHTNAEIAVALVLPRNTVQNYLSGISANRASLAAAILACHQAT
jgi:DNA-binding NarL/FixJ family response regulator